MSPLPVKIHTLSAWCTVEYLGVVCQLAYHGWASDPVLRAGGALTPIVAEPILVQVLTGLLRLPAVDKACLQGPSDRSDESVCDACIPTMLCWAHYWAIN